MYVSFQSDMKGVSRLGVQNQQKHKAGSSERNEDTKMGQEAQEVEGKFGCDYGRRMLTFWALRGW